MNQKELKELIEFLIEKDIAEFELERGDVKVKIKRAERGYCPGRAGRAFFYGARGATSAPEPVPRPQPRFLLPRLLRRPHLQLPTKGCTSSALPSSARSTSRPLPDRRLL